MVSRKKAYPELTCDLARQYLDIAGVILIAIDRKGTVTMINKKGCEILGYPEGKILGKNWFKNFIPKPMRKRVMTVFRKVISGKLEMAEHFENKVLTKGGKERLIAWHNSVLRDPNGKIISTLSSGEDITKQRQAEEELLMQKQKLEEMTHMRERFMTDIAHELKTPLSVIMLNLDMMKKLQNKPLCDITPIRGLLWRNAMRISKSIEQIMQLTAIESVKVRRRRFDISKAMDEIREDYSPIAESKKISLLFKGRKLEVTSDPRLLSAAIGNLVSNAIKFTSKGSVAISWRSSKRSVIITVSDTGIGIKPESQDKVFDMFFKEDHDTPGSGIGLSLSSEFVNRLRGKLRFTSKPGKGSTFKITLPKR